MNFKQGSNSFEHYANEIEVMNIDLEGTRFHNDDIRLFKAIRIGMNEDTKRHLDSNHTSGMSEGLPPDVYDLTKSPPELVNTGLKIWINFVNGLDEHRREEEHRTARQVQAIINNTNSSSARSNNCYVPRSFSNPSNPSSSSNPSNSNTNNSSPRLPRLTAAERNLLDKNDGCYKCRRFFAKHRTTDKVCDFPNTTNYRELTAADVDKARNSGNSNRSNTQQRSNNSGHVAAVINNNQEPSAALGNGSDSAHGYVPLPHEPLSLPPLLWSCCVNGPNAFPDINVDALLDNGSQFTLIQESVAEQAGLKRHQLYQAVELGSAFSGDTLLVSREVRLSVSSSVATHYTHLSVFDPSLAYKARVVPCLIVPDSLSYPVILGLPWLVSNHVVCDHSSSLITAIVKDMGFDLLHPEIPKTAAVLPTRKEIISFRKEMIAQLCDRLMAQKAVIDRTLEPLQELDHIAAVQQRIATIDMLEHLSRLNEKMKEKYKDRFPTDIRHVDDLPKDIYHRIRLKDPEKVISTHAYNSPRKYRDAWHTLLQQHISAGHIRPSDSPIASPAFIIPKADPMVLPRWVNDYRLVNENTIPDQHPLPLVDDILADCSKGQIWAKLDMTNAFFQTLVHPDDMKYTAVRTPWGLYEWTVMPMGSKNAPATHQRHMCSVLREYIGKICHVYFDDIIIWSQTVAEHVKNVATVLEALHAAKLFCSDKKTDLFCVEVDFLGHHISRRGIEPQSKKVDRIMNWTTPKTA